MGWSSPRVNSAEPAGADFSSDGTYPTKTVVVAPGKPIAEPVAAPFARQVEEYRKANKVPDTHSMQLQIRNYYQDGVGFHNMIAVATPINPAGKPDGFETHYQQYIGVIRTVNYKDGLKDGPEQEFAGSYATRYVKVELPWKEGKLQGVRRMLHPNGKPMAETTYENGLESGDAKSFDIDGNLIRKTPFKAGKREGELIDYWPGTDKVKRTVPFKAGKIEGVVKELFLEGKIKRETPFKNDKQHGIDKEYQPDGKVFRETYYVDGEEVSKDDFAKKFK